MPGLQQAQVMDDSFEIVARWLDQHGPERQMNVNSPTFEEQLTTVEETLGLELPVSVQSSYRPAKRRAYPGVGLDGRFTLMSLDEVIDAIDFLLVEFSQMESTTTHRTLQRFLEGQFNVLNV